MQRNLRWTALLFVLALVVAACGGGEGRTRRLQAGRSRHHPRQAVRAPRWRRGNRDHGWRRGTATTAGGEAAADLTGVELNVMGWASSAAEDEALAALLDPVQRGRQAPAQSSALHPTTTPISRQHWREDSHRTCSMSTAQVARLGGGRGTGASTWGAINDPDDIAPPLREAFTYDGTFYCPPKDFSTLALQYDPAAFEAAGWKSQRGMNCVPPPRH